jgi:hypothetical protein
MDSRICTYLNTVELDAVIQRIINELTNIQIISVVRTSEFQRLTPTSGDCADYIILYTNTN